MVTQKKTESNYQGIKVALLSTALSSGEKGGAERFYQGLLQGLKSLGCEADLIFIQADEPDFETILGNYQRSQELDLAAYDVVISTKAPSYAVNHPNHVLYLIHTIRIFDDRFESGFSNITTEHLNQRSKIHELDFESMSKVKQRFAIGHEVARRLYRWRGLSTEVIHPPLGFNEFKVGEIGDYFFLPGRLHAWKRVDLSIRAVKSSKMPLKLLIAGVGEDEARLRLLAGGDSRIQFLGAISDEELIDYYKNALAIPFTPISEDYGYVTLEAFASGKPVVTCSDSGEPTYFVRNGETGFVCEPSPDGLRDAFERLYMNKGEAGELGLRAKKVVADMSWEQVASKLVDAGLKTKDTQVFSEKVKVAVLDMQPIDPPVGGGRLRLLGLYHKLGDDIDCTYVGTYDWPGESYRRHRLSECLEEINIPLSDEHHSAAAKLSQKLNGKNAIDLMFSQQAHLSPDYIREAKEQIGRADVVVFSHPWVYRLLANEIKPGVVVVYDSHNVESYLRAQLLDQSNSEEVEVLKNVISDEYELGKRADLILACSHEDQLRFARIYDFPLRKIRIVPNGVMTEGLRNIDRDEKISLRKKLGLPASLFMAIFIGSPYGPNLEAAQFISGDLAKALPEVTFIIAGGVGATITACRTNVIVTGQLDDAGKVAWLQAADIAINPMFSGSGTNIKMFDFMVAGLPTVTTSTGARGIAAGARTPYFVCEPDSKSFAKRIKQLRASPELREQMGEDAKYCVEENYSWERISESLGRMLKSYKHFASQSSPLFSVIIPSYQRHGQLEELLERLQKQTERDFEVIIVDQSAEPWPSNGREYPFPYIYHHTPVKGAVRARNTGAMFAKGKIIAFTDDDCQPYEDWLVNARRYFTDENIVGVEGMIMSDHLNDEQWRPVTNVGFEGIGFMTANLMVRTSVFQLLGGFDLQFDLPHFREDTDFGWRMQELGEVPYADDVRVFHPAQPRSVKEESLDERNRFFIKDALLYAKHPEKYKTLYHLEDHFRKTPGFVSNLKRGFEQNNIELPLWMLDSFEQVNNEAES
ncbi:glycosyltransferase [Microbulbifer variabilis]|uniref:glycosyltransferase n=1 Tax=Microbulbifer variabilis TaxID=266805 RepID=UPI001CFDB0EA|nr:glycosyltransferase [Microbulbifer variabilis]